MALLDEQRAALLAGLVDPVYALLAMPELMYAYLGVVELRTEPTLLERLAAWAIANEVPVTLASIRLGF